MVFQKVTVINYQHQEEGGYLIEDNIYIKNGDETAKVSFFISNEAAEKYARKFIEWDLDQYIAQNYRLSDEDYKLIIHNYIRMHHKRIKSIFLRVIEKFAIYYKGFPSSISLVKEFKLLISSGPFQGTCIFLPDSGILWVFLEVNSLNLKPKVIEGTISHELYHIVAEVHELENEQSKLLLRWREKLNEPIKKNKKLVEKRIEEYVRFLEEFNLEFFSSEDIEESFLGFFGDWSATFWNKVIDSALCVIAIELEDKEYIQDSINRDEDSIKQLEYYLIELQGYKSHIEENATSRRDLFMSLIKLIEFIMCFVFMPYDGIAYGILGDNFRPRKKHKIITNFKKWIWRNESNKIIYKFKNSIKKYCEPDIVTGFLRFFDAYLEIIKAQAIHNDPLNPNVTKQIHDIIARKKASDAYKILNYEFNKLLMGIR